MKLVEALQLAQRKPSGTARPLRLFLACGFTPLHLQTFLTAHLRAADPALAITVENGLYGDTPGSIERIAQTPDLDAAAIALEWSDFDPRLGIRQLGGWSPAMLPDILDTVAAQIVRCEEMLHRAADHAPLAISFPTLPLPPLGHLPGWQTGTFELDLRQHAAAFAARLARMANVKIVNPQRLDLVSPLADRLDVASELRSGFPYRVAHAAALAELFARLIQPPSPKKGLITDLDDTLWSGIVGEVGHAGVSWSLNEHSHAHALYQQFLVSLADAGVLLAIASKNDPENVKATFEREDLVLRGDRVFPVEVSWGPKSEAVSRILAAWNIGAQSVVFVDDSPLELAEVKAQHPEIECLPFPAGKDQALYDLLVRLRDLFGKPRVSDEDAVRMQSLRDARQDGAPPVDAAQSDRFLSTVSAELTISFAKDTSDARPLELVNKTNQFNLNGRRHLEGAWQRRLKDPATFVLVANYQDKFGPLGKIAVLSGRAADGTITVDTWVMSCRAFARRVEYRCLELLFDRFSVDAVDLEYEPTAKNGPTREFLAAFGLATDAPGVLRLTRAAFAEHCPPLYHRVADGQKELPA